ncbi:pre-toxin TG domain-containing protein [Lysinibacillus sphaericus]|uniref:pre-toxin TG domain-containing protein n=1 Tax=Lysinibacillus sphaericus TaxID=1421 RepID=UPI00163B7572|nr:pre-toxin TG domain-containing protein [Lysinibacillus sp. SDF0037]
MNLTEHIHKNSGLLLFGNVKALYEMGTGKDLITGQTKQTGKKIITEAELEKYLKDRQSVSNGNRNSVNAGEPIKTLEDLQSVVGGGHHTLPQNKPTIVERFICTLLFEDIVTLVDPKSTTGERILAGLSMLPTSKPFKIIDAGYDTVKYYKKTTKIIEDSKKTYTSNNKKMMFQIIIIYQIVILRKKIRLQ